MQIKVQQLKDAKRVTFTADTPMDGLSMGLSWLAFDGLKGVELHVQPNLEIVFTVPVDG